MAKKKIIIATVLLVGLVLMLSLIAVIGLVSFFDPWKRSHTEEYLDYVEWTPPFKVKIMQSGLGELGRNKYDRLYYYSLDKISQDQLIAVRKADALHVYKDVYESTVLYYDPQTVPSPEALFETLYAELTSSLESWNTETIPISDCAYLHRLFTALLNARQMTYKEWNQLNGIDTKLNGVNAKYEAVATMTLYLDESRQLRIPLTLYCADGLYFWYNATDVVRGVYIPFDRELLDMVGDFLYDS